jgi:hypothetical protein
MMLCAVPADAIFSIGRGFILLGSADNGIDVGSASKVGTPNHGFFLARNENSSSRYGQITIAGGVR